MILKKSCIIPLIFLSTFYLHAQFKYQLDAEAGYSRIKQSGQADNNDLLLRFDGLAKYIYEDQKRTTSALVKIRPEFFSLSNSITSIKLKAEGTYFQREENFNWGLNLARLRNVYYDLSNDLTYDILFLTGEISFLIENQIPAALNSGYAFQNVSGSSTQEFDILFIDAKVYHEIIDHIKIGYGFYAEHFNIENKLLTLPSEQNFAQNKGWRGGPQITLNYFENGLVNIDYRFLLHNSKFTRYPSYEHSIRFVAGKILFSDWSLFLLVDYYTRNFSLSNSNDDEVVPLYIPLNIENKIYLKLGYDVSDTVEIYFKSGYFKENVYKNRYSFSGWNTLIGIGFSN